MKQLVNEPFFSLLCSRTFLATTLLIVGISAHQAVRLVEGVISKTKSINIDLYRAILFPDRKSFEADVTGLTALFFYPRFMRAILSGDFPELDGLRVEHRKISAYTVVLLGAVLCLFAWAVECKAP
jgi:hypothetical protein